MKKDTIRQGTAGVHLVCADLLLAGFDAHIAAEGLKYDLVLDADGCLYRVQVKSTRFLRQRKQRPTCPPAYQFLTSRGHRPDRPGEQSFPKRYNESQIDIIACVAIDPRLIAYLPVNGEALAAVYFYQPGTEPYERGGEIQRRCIDQFPITKALSELERGHPKGTVMGHIYK